MNASNSSTTLSGFEALLSGRVLGERYRVEGVIGRGGMGVVYHARDLRLDRPVAVKVIVAGPSDPQTRASLRTRFAREARAAARLHHPNVVAVYDFGTDPALDLDYLVMELLRGEDLASVLARSTPLPLPAALAILHDAARGLAAGHGAGMIHRDVKPGNIFLDRGEAEDGVRALVLDFGIVQLAEDDDEATRTQLTRFGQVPHSPAYAAPEQVAGTGCLSPACDVWSLGAVAFHLLTGERAFGDADRQRMAEGRPVPPLALRARTPAIPPEVEQAVMRALAPRPADRFPHAGAFADALAHARRNLPSAPEDRSWLAPPVSPSPAAPSSPEWTAMAEPRDVRPAFPRAHPVEPRSMWSQFRAFVRGVVTGGIGLGVIAGWVQLYAADQEGRSWLFYTLLGVLSVAAPVLIHRVMGGRGRLRTGLFFSALIAGGALYYTIPGTWQTSALLFVPAAQLAVSALAERITRRSPRDGRRSLPGYAEDGYLPRR